MWSVYLVKQFTTWTKESIHHDKEQKKSFLNSPTELFVAAVNVATVDKDDALFGTLEGMLTET